jgi:streptomycin 6-kinase
MVVAFDEAASAFPGPGFDTPVMHAGLAAARLALVEHWAKSPPPELVALGAYFEGLYSMNDGDQKRVANAFSALARRLRGGA